MIKTYDPVAFIRQISLQARVSSPGIGYLVVFDRTNKHCLPILLSRLTTTTGKITSCRYGYDLEALALLLDELLAG